MAAAKGFVEDRQWNWYNFWVCLLIGFFGQTAFGYYSTIISTTLAQPAFLKYMGLLTASNADNLIGATTGVFQAGGFFGVVIGSFVIDRWGRKAGVIYCSVLSLIGGAVMTGSTNIATFIVFRFFAGAGCYGYFAQIPVYTAELAPPKLRGFFVGVNGWGVAIGTGLAIWMGLAFFFAPSPTTQWRGPLGVALIFPALCLAILPFVPESPRWLLLQGHTEQARAIALRLHHNPRDPDDRFARAEFYQMQRQTELEKNLSPSWAQIWRKPSYRRRVLLVCTFGFFGQSTAVLVINNFGPTFYGALGYKTLQQLELQSGWICVAILSNFVGSLILDRVGRRPLMITGLAGCCACLIVETAMVATYASPVPAIDPNKAGLRTGVAAFYIFLVFYGMGIDVVGIVFYSEVFPNFLRAKGVAATIATIVLTDLIYLQVATTAFAHVGWKFFLLFVLLSGIGAVWAFFFIPETKGLPLEEVAAIFGDREEVVVWSGEIRAEDVDGVVGEEGMKGVEEGDGEAVGRAEDGADEPKLNPERNVA